MDCGTFRVTLLHCVNLTIQKTQACFWDQRQPLVGIPKTSQIVSKSLAINSHSMEIPWNILSLPRIDKKWKKWPLVILNIFNFKLQRNFFSVKEEKKGERERSKVGERKRKEKKNIYIRMIFEGKKCIWWNYFKTSFCLLDSWEGPLCYGKMVLISTHLGWFPENNHPSTGTGGRSNSTMYLWVCSTHYYKWQITEQNVCSQLSITCEQGFYRRAYQVQSMSLTLNYDIVPQNGKKNY